MQESVLNDLELFGINVFTYERMKEQLQPDVFNALRRTMEEGRELSLEVADAVADAMRIWAMEKGATHFTHWFQPMTGSTAEKHDSFLDIPGLDAKPLLRFSGKSLIRGEADGSSFPSGGLRATFEARGYTTWDVTSPAFVKQDPQGVNVLCIPTAFSSFSGDALDEKTPLLRSMEALNRQSLRVLRHLGVDSVKRITPTVGGEQEYFLIDKQQFSRRKDLVYTGRTLFGAPPAKGQELGDQYYATTPERVAKYMRELNLELWKLGVPAKTEHNEVAPAQYELAPLFASSTVACDHNQIIMEQMRRVADRHGFTCLLHEKPFAGVNGSGKHNNWSLCTDAGKNLLKPPRDEKQTSLFMTFLIAIISAVDEYAAALRMCCATISNEQRLGGHEAPPPILSVFTGVNLYDKIAAFVQGSDAITHERELFNIGVSTRTTLYKDDTDRNRTSPFAFTGDKFEFRMVGSSQSLGLPNTVLNTVVAEMLRRIADVLDAATDKEQALKAELSSLFDAHRRVIFNGNNYAAEWTEEAKRRGLPVIESTVDAISVLGDPAIMEVFRRHGVFSETELNARLEVGLTNYNTHAKIEAITMHKISLQKLLPASVRYSGTLAGTVRELVSAGVEPNAQRRMLEKLNAYIAEYYDAIEELGTAIAATQENCSTLECSLTIREKLQPAMKRVRAAADALECIVDKAFWPIPSYGEMLFYVI